MHQAFVAATAGQIAVTQFLQAIAATVPKNGSPSTADLSYQSNITFLQVRLNGAPEVLPIGVILQRQHGAVVCSKHVL